MSASLSSRHEASILPSLPPSPSLLDEVFNQPHRWSVRVDESGPHTSGRSRSSSASSRAKGKGKKLTEDGGEDDGEVAQQRVSTHDAYPPMTDEAAETRRIEETLRRWELAERQRRKSLRDTVQQPSGPSLLTSVTRTASLVLSRRSGSISASVVGQGTTRTFKAQEPVDVAREGYAVPLDDVDHANAVAVHSPSPSVFEHRTSTDVALRAPENPFVHPSENEHAPARMLTPVAPTPPSPSPFSDARAQPVDLPTHARRRSSESGGPHVEPPNPLPPEDKPCVTPPERTPQPVLWPPRRDGPEERQEIRWWHDWLCGCGEGPDRGGDNQAGRTNPFE